MLHDAFCKQVVAPRTHELAWVRVCSTVVLPSSFCAASSRSDAHQDFCVAASHKAVYSEHSCPDANRWYDAIHRIQNFTCRVVSGSRKSGAPCSARAMTSSTTDEDDDRADLTVLRLLGLLLYRAGGGGGSLLRRGASLCIQSFCSRRQYSTRWRCGLSTEGLLPPVQLTFHGLRPAGARGNGAAAT